MAARWTPLLFLLVACAGSDSAPWSGAVRDSSGVRIVENSGRGLWTASTEWRVAEDLSIGRSDGDDAYLFGRVADVAVDSRNRIVVLDAVARQVRVFDSEGAFVLRFAGPGSGPGELSGFANTVLVGPGDTVFLPDWAQTRISVFDPDGEYVRAVRLPPRPGGRSWERTDSGTFVFRGLTLGRDSAGSFTTSDGLFEMSGESAALDTLLTFEYPASPLGAPGQPIVPLIVNGAVWCRLPDGRIAWTSLDRDEIRITSGGRPRAILRNSGWTRQPVSEPTRLLLRERLREKLSLMGGDAAAVDQLRLVYDETLPSITDLRAGPEGTLWVQRMSTAGDIDPFAVNSSDATGWLGGRDWSVLDADGRLLGDVSMPGRVRITRITDDAIYGVRKGSDDVETVIRLRMVRPTVSRRGWAQD